MAGETQNRNAGNTTNQHDVEVARTKVELEKVKGTNDNDVKIAQVELDKEKLRKDMEVLMEETRERVAQREAERLEREMKEKERTKRTEIYVNAAKVLGMGAMALGYGIVKVLTDADVAKHGHEYDK